MDEKTSRQDAWQIIFSIPSEINILLLLIILFSIFSVYEESIRVVKPIGGLLVFFLHGLILYEFENNYIWPALIILSFIISVLAVTIALPYFLQRKDGLRPMRDINPEVEKEVYELAGDAGVKRHFRILYSASPSIEIYVTGTLKERYLILSQGFMDKFLEKKNEYHAIISHEIAHIIHKDAFRADVARSFVLVYAVYIALFFILHIANIAYRFYIYGPTLQPWDPTGLSSIGNAIPAYIVNFIPSIFNLVILAVLFLAIAYLIRRMELYADLRATMMLNDKRPLYDAITRFDAITVKQNVRRFSFVSRPAGMLSVKYHPSSRERKGYIDKPEGILEIKLWAAVVIGVLAGSFNSQIVNGKLVISIILGLFPGLASDVFLSILGNISVFTTAIIAVFLFLPSIHAITMANSWGRRNLFLLLASIPAFFIGYVAIDYIFINVNMVFQCLIMTALYSYYLMNTGSTHTFIFNFGYFGAEYPMYHPVMALVSGVFFSAILVMSLALYVWYVGGVKRDNISPAHIKNSAIYLFIFPGLICSIASILFFFSIENIVHLNLLRADMAYVLSLLLIAVILLVPLAGQKIYSAYNKIHR